ncbi:MAG: tetratricopeptide repeat protein [Candidatus Aminicenantes bacterium]|nr:tetratricopeptide repeat protein [Candidatus Aminicenantes bacterium]
MDYPLKIFTLGGFEIQLGGKPLFFSARAPEKPLDLLKAVVALGRPSAPVEILEDALWPDAEGDKAAGAFDTTLHRLRKLLDCENALVLRERTLGLDVQCVWVDAREFERLCSDFEAGSSDGSPESLLEYTAKARTYYRGEFLPADKRQAWTVSYREKMRGKWLGLVVKLGRAWEGRGEWERAAELYGQGLDTDDLVEDFYQGLMTCHLQLGNRSRALEIYSRCRKVLDAAWGIEPSEKTEGLYRSLKARRP